MIYLQTFTSRNSNFSGFNRIVSPFYPSSFIGQIPIDITRMVGLKNLNLSGEHLLEGYLHEDFDISLFSLLIGEFPLVEGSFSQLTYVGLPVKISGSFKISS